MSKAQRLLSIMLSINNKKQVTIGELAEEQSVSERTISRDLQELSELHFPVYSETGRNGGYRVLEDRLLPPIMFAEQEAISMYFAIESLKFIGATPFYTSSASALHKFYKHLPHDTQSNVDKMKDKLVVWQPSYPHNEKYLQTLLEAALHEHQATITYQSIYGPNKRRIYPLGLYSYKGYWYCPAYCFSKSSYRLFRVDRVIEAHPEPNFRKPLFVDVSMKEWLYPDDKLYDPISLNATLTDKGFHRCESNLWLNGFICTNEDGSKTIQLQFSREKLEFYTEMIWELGEEVQVHEPQEMIEKLVDKASALIQHYK